jgi:hypothetical protein
LRGVKEEPDITRKSSLRLDYGIRGSFIVHRMPVYVNVARSYYKVGDLAGTHWKHAERAGR